MVKDRLQQLQLAAQTENDEYEMEEKNVQLGVCNTIVDIEHEETGYMVHFFNEVEHLRSLIENIKEHIKAIKTLHGSVLSSPKVDESMKRELEARNETVKQIAKKVNSNLKLLERGIVQEEEELENKNVLSAALRIRKTQHATTLRLLVDAVTEFNAEQVDYKDKCEERIQRVVSIAKAEITDEKLEELLEEGSYGAIFNGDIITETMEMKKTLEEVQIRHQELVKLEKSITELRTLFVEMALLVEQQGDIVNSIEHHVCQAGEALETAKLVTRKAMIYQEKAKMKKMIIFATTGALVVIIIIFLLSPINRILGVFESKKV